MAHEAGKAAIIAVNKWDLIEKETGTQAEYEEKIRTELAYMPYAPMIFLSAKTGQRVENLFELIKKVHASATMRITTGSLNAILADATARVQPPTFICFCNDARLFHFSYLRYLENQIRQAYAMEGTPVKMVIRQKGEDL